MHFNSEGNMHKILLVTLIGMTGPLFSLTKEEKWALEYHEMQKENYRRMQEKMDLYYKVQREIEERKQREEREREEQAKKEREKNQ